MVFSNDFVPGLRADISFLALSGRLEAPAAADAYPLRHRDSNAGRLLEEYDPTRRAARRSAIVQ
jgi:hypothetical protein